MSCKNILYRSREYVIKNTLIFYFSYFQIITYFIKKTFFTDNIREKKHLVLILCAHTVPHV